MPQRKIPFVTKEIYHVLNRGTEKINIFRDRYDLERFFLSMRIFNNISPIGSIWEFGGKTPKKFEPLVDFICYSLNPNHFHFLLIQVYEGGISEFMKRMGGYTSYFNEKYKRTGSLYESKFKAIHVSNNTQLLHVSAYINLNNYFKDRTSILSKSSWEEYIGEDATNFCKKEIILDQFISIESYKTFALASLKDIVRRKN